MRRGGGEVVVCWRRAVGQFTQARFRYEKPNFLALPWTKWCLEPYPLINTDHSTTACNHFFSEISEGYRTATRMIEQS